ncbi:MAG: hypothetical protein AB7E10_12430, partial [Burkholderiaceae bacterium]
RTEAANAAQFHWKWIVGLASMATVAVVGWGVFGALREQGASAVQLAASQPAVPLVAVVDSTGAQQLMLRDPRLDELLAAHQQYGYTPALQMPAGFLRNAAFESAGGGGEPSSPEFGTDVWSSFVQGRQKMGRAK